MNALIRFGIEQLVKYQLKEWDKSVVNPGLYQEQIFKRLITQSRKTLFGRDHKLDSTNTYSEFCNAVPLRTYEDYLNYINKIKLGEPNVLYPGVPKYFAKSSGTTSSVKLIPVTDNFTKTYSKAGFYMLCSYMRETNNYDLLFGVNLFIQGTPLLEEVNGIKTGVMSGISHYVMPKIIKRKQLPTFETNILLDWEEKINNTVIESLKADLHIIGGIPPWVLMYIDALIDNTQKRCIKEVFPNLILYVAGGVNLEAYRNIIYQKLGSHIHILDTYTASEGFFGFQESINNPAMTICSNNEIFYEFVKYDDYIEKKSIAKRVKLVDIQINTEYVLVVNSLSGLYGYVVGDTIRFIQRHPFKFLVTGRIAQFTSLFGEHIIASEVHNAINLVINKFNLTIRAFTIAPKLVSQIGQSHLECWIEFNQTPVDLVQIAADINLKLCQQNWAYKNFIEGKVIDTIKIISVQPKVFERCFLKEKIINGQNKISVLSNNRELVNRLESYRL